MILDIFIIQWRIDLESNQNYHQEPPSPASTTTDPNGSVDSLGSPIDTTNQATANMMPKP